MKVYGLQARAISTRRSRPWPEGSPQTFIVPEAEVSIAFTAFNNNLAISFIA